MLVPFRFHICMLCFIAGDVFADDFENNFRKAGTASLREADSQWESDTIFSEKDERLLKEISKTLSTQSIPPVTRLRPIVVEGKVLMRTSNTLEQRELATGKIVWTYPFLRRSISNHQSDTKRSIELEHRLLRDAVFNQICSDGKRVFFAQSMDKDQHFSGKYDHLVALRVDGKPMWLVGGPDGEDEPKLADTRFLGTSVLDSDCLLTLVEQQGVLRLVKLSINDGKMLWAFDVAELEGQLHVNSRLRQTVGVVPIVRSSLAVCPTHAGEVVAVDLKNIRRRWRYTYPSKRRKLNADEQYDDWWIDESQFIAENRIVLTPADSQRIHCLDVMTGALNWTSPRNNAMFVAGIRDRTVVVVGKNTVKGLGLENGVESWESKPLVPGNATISGLGYFSPDSYFVPTTSSEIVQVNIRDGTIVGRIPTKGILGNLTLINREVLSQGATTVSLHGLK
jgi:outer membrane protein assembly factor BamB